MIELIDNIEAKPFLVVFIKWLNCNVCTPYFSALKNHKPFTSNSLGFFVLLLSPYVPLNK